MAQLAGGHDRGLATQDALLPDGEFAILVCLTAVPVIWAVLIVPMMCTCEMATATSLLFGVATGGLAALARLLWLHRCQVR